MTANRKIVGLCSVVAASALLAGCTTEVTDPPELEAGRFDVMALELGNCGDGALLPSTTPMRSIVVDPAGDDFVFNACTESGCAPASPSQYAWRNNKWVAETGGAFLVETGCLLLHVSSTARLENGELVVETTRWSEVASGSCTLAEVTAMFERPCDLRSRVLAVAAIAH